MSEKLKRFTDLLKQIFELDKSDLDFGIYRILNIKKEQIEKFLTEELPKKVQDTLAPYTQGNKDEIKTRMAEIEQALGDVTAIPNNVPMKVEYLDLQKQLAEGTDLSALETDVYSALYSFFNRYYDEGDFISKRRYKEGVYAIPYEGEEVKLYWANQDQYYIKTSESFKDYSFLVGDYTVHFKLVDATTEQNNNKESADNKRVFMLFTEDEQNYPDIKTFEYNDEKKELIIHFIFDIQDKYTGKSDTIAKKWLEDNYNAIYDYVSRNRLPLWRSLLTPLQTGKENETTTLLEKHLKGYVAKNTFDYFIHKDLRGFLRRELDFYIKNEIMHLDDLDTGNETRVETYLAKVKAIKSVGKIIIDFLAQLENFQKKLWLKKKFVVETNWCMTLDRVDESFWPEIINNKAQIDEWIEMYAIDEIVNDLDHQEPFTNPPSIDFLRQNKNLLIDTKHFNDDFKARLVSSIDRLDDTCNGIMFNGDNFHVLNLLSSRYKGKIDCEYFDPPYNTSESTFIYKNNYKHSSWCSMIENRCMQAKNLLNDAGVMQVAIDDLEYSYLVNVLDSIFGLKGRLGNLCVEINPSGRTNDSYYSTSHEYLLSYSKDVDDVNINFFELSEEQKKQYKEISEAGVQIKWRDFLRTGGYSTPEERPNSYYPIYYQESTRTLSLDYSKDAIEILPIDSKGKKRVWRKTKPSFLYHLKNNEIKCVKIKDSYKIRIIDKIKEGIRPKSLWTGSKYDASTYGTKLIQNILGTKNFSFPKSIHNTKDVISLICNEDSIVLDIFAGSGTTGHAVIELNRTQEDFHCKYILVEMGSYFNTVTKPRILKVIYSSDWRDGKPLNRNTGISQIIKYMSLESYEDALSNIKLKDNSQDMRLHFGEEYLIQYMLDLESKDSLLNIDAFKNPFDYKMNITEKNENKKRPVDLVETFNYLIGLTVTRQGTISYFTAKPASEPEYEGAVELRKDLGGQYAFQQIDGKLPDGRRALVIWRTVTDNILESNAALDAYFTKYRINPADREYDVIFVNCDSNLENLRTDNENWKVQMTEIEFKKRMFEEE